MIPGLPESPRLRAEVRRLGVSLAGARPLPGGSVRRFYRLAGAPPVVLLYHPRPPGAPVNENDSYFQIGRHLRRQGVPVPEIYAYCREEGWFLLEDVGDLSLEAALTRPGADWRRLYREALEILIRQQVAGREGFDPAWCFDTPRVTREFLLTRECHYFVEAFLRGYVGLEVGVAELEADFRTLVAAALPGGPEVFLHRDYQSRNLHLHQGRLWVLDFQGGRLGPAGYDPAALLLDPYVDLGEAREKELGGFYLALLRQKLPGAAEAFRESYFYLALCRNLQVLGAFGFLTAVQGKSPFAAAIPAALRGLGRRLATRPGIFPALEEVTRLAAARLQERRR
ncbi:MAG: phosphotransferase [Syntrophobacterales bacterium]|nr:phosphotransferase [Syntrophobacterales bacterium]